MTDHTRPARRPGRRGPEVRCRTVPTAPVSAEHPVPVAAPGVREPAAADPLTVEIARVRGDTAVVAVAGEIDLRTADTLCARLVEIHGEGSRRIVADFAGVPFCDAAGLGALVAAHNRISVSGGEIALARVRPAQARLLSITGLDRLFAVHADVTGALADHDPSTTSR
ncbi:anti-anti-sigma factor [Actinomadura pelletieri DSM 43383]|uniref:Anti-sigma factor antagonist n=1 Tax=Actinomadura pelletieri DSM 43383 TaxID=1120940 RepID=A0A495Q970_9ACTN|nr:anti-anti-sigma factor [Actinomadura pelletieri DSM 43383]